jgi:TetR/AcrR family transcriptional repressor of nem operon
MSAEYDDLPDAVKKEVQAFADVNVAWLSKVLAAARVVAPKKSEEQARAIFTAVAGAQLVPLHSDSDRLNIPRLERG